MPTLTGQKPSDTYTFLLQINDGVVSSLKAVQDGSGVETPLQLSTTAVAVDGLLKLLANSQSVSLGHHPSASGSYTLRFPASIAPSASYVLSISSIVGSVVQFDWVLPGIIGELKMFAMASLPSGWLALGQAVSRSTYSALFAQLGTTWGSGNGTTTFDLPPKGHAPVPAGAQSGLTTRALGDRFGAENVTLTGAQSGTAAHSHGAGTLSGVVDSLTVTVTDPGHTHGPGTLAGSLTSTTLSLTDGGHTHGTGSLAGTVGTSVTITDPGHTHTVPITTATDDTPTASGSEKTTTTSNTSTSSNTTGITAALASGSVSISGDTASNSTGITGSVSSGALTITTGATASGSTSISAALASGVVTITGTTANAAAADAASSHNNLGPRAAYTFGIFAGV